VACSNNLAKRNHNPPGDFPITNLEKVDTVFTEKLIKRKMPIVSWAHHWSIYKCPNFPKRDFKNRGNFLKNVPFSLINIPIIKNICWLERIEDMEARLVPIEQSEGCME